MKLEPSILAPLAPFANPIAPASALAKLSSNTESEITKPLLFTRIAPPRPDEPVALLPMNLEPAIVEPSPAAKCIAPALIPATLSMKSVPEILTGDKV